jgi:hypothetical protein
VNEQVGSADVIVLSIDAEGGVPKATDLVRSGVATRVAVFTMVGGDCIRRGIANEDVSTRSVGQVRALGVDNIDQIPIWVAGTEDEGPVLAEWATSTGSASSWW